MATHNQMQIIGYILKDPMIINEGTDEEKITMQIRTVRRELDNFYGAQFYDVMLYYDGKDEALYNKIKSARALDVVDIKAVFNMLTLTKNSKCPNCECINGKEGSSFPVIYPLSFLPINNFTGSKSQNPDLPDYILEKNYKEVSNQILLIGNLANEPELFNVGNSKVECCRYCLGVDRKYFIPTQSDITVDFPYVYNYGQDARNDERYLHTGSCVMVDGFLRYRNIESEVVCEQCGETYTFPDQAAEIVPYSVEYLQNFFTEDEVKEMEREDYSTQN